MEGYDGVLLCEELRGGEKNRPWGHPIACFGEFAHVDMCCSTERLVRADGDHLFFRRCNHACDYSILRKYQWATVFGRF